MAQFRGTIKGQRGEASRLGSRSTGLVTTCNGWNIGVKVEAEARGKTAEARDVMRVLVTGGSNAAFGSRHIATIHEVNGEENAVEVTLYDENGDVIKEYVIRY